MVALFCVALFGVVGVCRCRTVALARDRLFESPGRSSTSQTGALAATSYVSVEQHVSASGAWQSGFRPKPYGCLIGVGNDIDIPREPPRSPSRPATHFGRVASRFRLCSSASRHMLGIPFRNFRTASCRAVRSPLIRCIRSSFMEAPLVWPSSASLDVLWRINKLVTFRPSSTSNSTLGSHLRLNIPSGPSGSLVFSRGGNTL